VLDWSGVDVCLAKNEVVSYRGWYLGLCGVNGLLQSLAVSIETAALE
jgi:hypothetical protein